MLLVTLLAACRPPAPTVDREAAYRANNTGVAWLEQFQYEPASAEFRRALQVDPSMAIAHLNLSLALLYSQDLAGAAREAEQADRAMPQSPRPAYVLGLIARADNRNDEAARLFERVRRIDARDSGAAINLAQMYLQSQRYAEATALMRPAVADEPYSITAAYTLGLALTRGGHATEGRQWLEKSQALRGTGYGVAFGTGYLEQGAYAEAVASTGAEPELVDRRVPAATFIQVAIGSQTSTALAGSGAVAAIDVDNDDDPDLFVADGGGWHLFRNDRGQWTDITAGAFGSAVHAGEITVGAVAGDDDNDGRADLLVLRDNGLSLLHNDGGRFRDVTAEVRWPRYDGRPATAAWADVDHDGDLDLVIAGSTDRAGPLQLIRNNGNGTFTDITREAGLSATGRAIAIVPTDFDNRRDLDLLVVYRDTGPRLFKNMRDGTFKNVAEPVGLSAAWRAGDEITAVAAGDINHDDFQDFFFSRASGGVLALSDGHGRFTIASAPAGTNSATAAQLFDYDADGLLDVLTWTAAGPRLLRNLGNEWSDVTAHAFEKSRAIAPPSAHGLALADFDGDGFIDIAAGVARGVGTWRNSGDRSRHSLRVGLKGLASNKIGIGAKVQMRAGSLTARVETSAATPPVAPAGVVFGLGSRGAADAVRVLWPSGILQTETTLSSPLVVTELNRKPSSCPFLFTWNGQRFEFITDFMGAGEMGYWEGPGKWNRPYPVEYVRVTGAQLQPKDGRLEIRVTNELEEALFADRFQLLAIAHPRDVDVFPNEGMTEPPRPFQLHAVRDERVPARVTDDHGHDVTESVVRVDRKYPDDFPVDRFRGYAARHTLTIDAGPVSAPLTFLLTAWTDYAFSSDNRAAHQAGLSLTSPTLEVEDAAGHWRTVVADIGIPVGRPQTIALDLSGKLKPREHLFRIVTNMRIYWDQIHVATTASAEPMRIVRMDPSSAMLRERGFSAIVQPDGKEPERYDYSRVSLMSPWKVMPGRYTRVGDVGPLLVRADDQFAIAKPGDEIAIQFDAQRAGALPAGWTRTYLLMADGFSKEMDVNSASPDVLEPLPFHAMSHYPYASPEHYPDTPANRRYLDLYNTRIVAKPLLSLDLRVR